jgi:hypothetical protein
MPESATASVGDSTAASAKAGISGIPGTIQYQKANADHRHHHQRQRQAEDLSPVLKKFAGRRFPAIGKQQRRDKQTRNSSGSNSTCKPKVGHASSAPMAICINGSGT